MPDCCFAFEDIDNNIEKNNLLTMSSNHLKNIHGLPLDQDWLPQSLIKFATLYLM